MPFPARLVRGSTTCVRDVVTKTHEKDGLGHHRTGPKHSHAEGSTSSGSESRGCARMHVCANRPPRIMYSESARPTPQPNTHSNALKHNDSETESSTTRSVPDGSSNHSYPRGTCSNRDYVETDQLSEVPSEAVSTVSEWKRIQDQDNIIPFSRARYGPHEQDGMSWYESEGANTGSSDDGSDSTPPLTDTNHSHVMAPPQGFARHIGLPASANARLPDDAIPASTEGGPDLPPPSPTVPASASKLCGNRVPGLLLVDSLMPLLLARPIRDRPNTYGSTRTRNPNKTRRLPDYQRERRTGVSKEGSSSMETGSTISLRSE